MGCGSGVEWFHMALIPSNSASSRRRLIDFREATRELQEAIDAFVANRPPLKLLEAGCGSCTNLRLPSATYLVGIDVSAKQLERNESLDEKILGDLENCDLPQEKFDLVVCW